MRKVAKQTAIAAAATAIRLASTAGATGEQHGGGDRAGPRHQRNREGEGRDIADMVDRHRVARDLALALATQGEQHVEADIEQQQLRRRREKRES
jgi:hypothetical protein